MRRWMPVRKKRTRHDPGHAAEEVLLGVGQAERTGTFERFTRRARESVQLAQEEARALNHNYIGTEHILLGDVPPAGHRARPRHRTDRQARLQPHRAERRHRADRLTRLGVWPAG
jgi:Clp amino terminal domain, pathogenicity island component